MAKKFNITAQLVLKGPNLQPVIAKIKSGLKGINTNIKLNINASSITSLNNTSHALNTLNMNLKSIVPNARAATQAISALGHAISQSQTGLKNLSRGISSVATSSNKIKGSVDASVKSLGSFGEMVGLTTKKFLAWGIAAGPIISLLSSFREGVESAVRFQREMVKFAQVGQDGTKTIRGVEDEIGKLSATLGVSSEKLSKVSVTLRQAGMSATETKKALDVLAKTELAPTFDNIESTTEGVIAIMNQFKVKAGELNDVMSALNTVSAQYPVESADIVEAAKRAGGAFKAAGGNFQEFMALFTSVRSTTRESAETIATGMRTIFARLERPQTLKNLKELGIVLENKGNFVGPFEAVKRLSEALKEVPENSTRFAKIADEIGGIRQLAKVIPLIKEFTLAQEALNVAQKSRGSIDRDAATAQQALIIKVTKLKEEFLELFRVLSRDTALNAMIDVTLALATNLTQATKALSPFVSLLTLLAGFKAMQFVKRSVPDFVTGLTKTKPLARAQGGFVPGQGNTDSVPAMLTPGEFVITKGAAQKIGYGNLQKMNKYAKGGIVNANPYLQKYLNNVGLGGIKVDGLAKKTFAVKKLLEPDTQVQSASMGFYAAGAGRIFSINDVATLLHELGHAMDNKGYAQHHGQTLSDNYASSGRFKGMPFAKIAANYLNLSMRHKPMFGSSIMGGAPLSSYDNSLRTQMTESFANSFAFYALTKGNKKYGTFERFPIVGDLMNSNNKYAKNIYNTFEENLPFFESLSQTPLNINKGGDYVKLLAEYTRDLKHFNRGTQKFAKGGLVRNDNHVQELLNYVGLGKIKAKGIFRKSYEIVDPRNASFSGVASDAGNMYSIRHSPTILHEFGHMIDLKNSMRHYEPLWWNYDKHGNFYDSDIFDKAVNLDSGFEKIFKTYKKIPGVNRKNPFLGSEEPFYDEPTEDKEGFANSFMGYALLKGLKQGKFANFAQKNKYIGNIQNFHEKNQNFQSIVKTFDEILPQIEELSHVESNFNRGLIVRKENADIIRSIRNEYSTRNNLHFASGGVVPGQGNTDKVPAMLTPGEFVVNKKAAQMLGFSKLSRLNHYAKRGKVVRGDTHIQDLLASLGLGGIDVKDILKKAYIFESANVKGMAGASFPKTGRLFTNRDPAVAVHEVAHMLDYQLARAMESSNFGGPGKKISEYASTHKGSVFNTISSLYKKIPNVQNKSLIGREGLSSYSPKERTREAFANSLSAYAIHKGIESGTINKKEYPLIVKMAQTNSEFQKIIKLFDSRISKIGQFISNAPKTALNPSARAREATADFGREVLAANSYRGMPAPTLRQRFSSLAAIPSKLMDKINNKLYPNTDMPYFPFTPPKPQQPVKRGKKTYNPSLSPKDYLDTSQFQTEALSDYKTRRVVGLAQSLSKPGQTIKEAHANVKAATGVVNKEIYRTLKDQIQIANPHLSGKEVASQAKMMMRKDVDVMVNQKGNLVGSYEKQIQMNNQITLGQSHLKATQEKLINALEKRISSLHPEMGVSEKTKLAEKMYAEHVAAYGVPSSTEIRKFARKNKIANTVSTADIFAQTLLPTPRKTLGGTIGKGVHRAAMTFGGKLGTFSQAAGFFAPMIMESIFGTAEKPKIGGTAGAGFGAVMGGGLSGAAIGSMLGPYGALAGAAIGAVGALTNFKEQLESVRLEKLNKDFSEALGGINSKTGQSNKKSVAALTLFNKELNQDIKTLDDEKKSARENIRAFNSFNPNATNKEFEEFRKDAFVPVKEMRDKFREKYADSFQGTQKQLMELAQNSPTKNFNELTAGNEDLKKTISMLSIIYKDEMDKMKKVVDASSRFATVQVKAQNAMTKLLIAFDNMRDVVEITTGEFEKANKRVDVGRGAFFEGRVSGGAESMNLDVMGEAGKELRKYIKPGGLLTQGRNALLDVLKSPDFNPMGIENGTYSIEDKLKKHPAFQGILGNSLLSNIVQNATNPENLGLLMQFKEGKGGVMPEDVAKRLEGDLPGQLKNQGKGMESDVGKLSDVFDSNVSKLFEKVNGLLEEKVRVGQFGLENARGNTLQNIRRRQQPYVQVGNRLVSNEEQEANVNFGFAQQSARLTQMRFAGEAGIGEAQAFNPQALVDAIKERQAQLQSLQAKQQANPNDVNTRKEIFSTTNQIVNLRSALKNLSTSTVELDAAQQRLQVALDKEAADTESRRNVGETIAFGTAQDRQRMMMSEMLTQHVARNGPGAFMMLNDTQRQMIGEHLNTTAGMPVAPDLQGVTRGQLRQMLVGEFTPMSTMDKRGIAQLQATHQNIANNMMNAGNLNNQLESEQIFQTLIQDAQIFDQAINRLTMSIEQLVKESNKGVPGKATGGLIYAMGGKFIPRGTDTVPAMLTPGEFIVNKKATQANYSILKNMNAGMSYKAFGGFADEGNPDVMRDRIKARARVERAREIEKRVRRREELGLPTYIPPSQRKPIKMTNAFDDVEANRLHHESTQRATNNFRRASAASMQSLMGSRFSRGNFNGANQQNQNNVNQRTNQVMTNNAAAMNNFALQSKPLVEALNSFPKEINIRRDGVVQVVINGAEAMSKVKGDLEAEVWKNIVKTIEDVVDKKMRKAPL